MSCNATYPAEATECPNCQVALSLVRKCPSCERTQSAQHLTCIYCANSFMQEDGLSVLAAGPWGLREKSAYARIQKFAALAVSVLILAGLAYYLYSQWVAYINRPIARTFVVRPYPVVMRKSPASNAPPVKDLQPSEKVDITKCVYDSAGNRWFRVISAGIKGYVSTEDVAPPEATKGDPDGGYAALRHSLLHLGDPAMLDYARDAVEYYHSIFPGNHHGDELTWLLAEQTRELAARSDRPRKLLATAREQYQKLANSGGEYAMRAREALDQLASEPTTQPRPRSSKPRPLEFSIVGGTSGGTPTTAGGAAGSPVRKVMVLDQTPLAIRLTSPLEMVPGAQGEGEIAEDIHVRTELAIPQGSRARLSVGPKSQTPGSSPDATSLTLRLTALVIGDQTYPVSAFAVRSRPASTLPLGTRIEFRLTTPLVLQER
ncbi:MAG: hypothetical protein ACE145_03975 [Terriglobia bacterium]